MSNIGQQGSSHLFLVRVLPEDATQGQHLEGAQWCGKVQRVVDGEAYDFCGWSELIEHLVGMLSDRRAGADPERKGR